jgi:hypothetical protein
MGREARKIKFLRPLRFLRLNHPKGTAIAVPLFVTFVLFVVTLSYLFRPLRSLRLSIFCLKPLRQPAFEQ